MNPRVNGFSDEFKRSPRVASGNSQAPSKFECGLKSLWKCCLSGGWIETYLFKFHN